LFFLLHVLFFLRIRTLKIVLNCGLIRVTHHHLVVIKMGVVAVIFLTIFYHLHQLWSLSGLSSWIYLRVGWWVCWIEHWVTRVILRKLLLIIWINSYYFPLLTLTNHIHLLLLSLLFISHDVDYNITLILIYNWTISRNSSRSNNFWWIVFNTSLRRWTSHAVSEWFSHSPHKSLGEVMIFP